ncbi:MAG: tetratricopeptide repeat protein [Cyanobacteria bacterium J06632_3]
MKTSLKTVYQQQLAKLVYRRGITYTQQQSFQQAIAAFTQAIEKGYSNPAEARVMIGISRIQTKDLAGAKADFESIIADADIELDNKASDATERKTEHNTDATLISNLPLAQAYHYRGRLRQKEGNEAGALADWSEAIRIKPNYPEPHYHRALVHLSQGLHSKALADFDAVLTADPTLANAYYHRGNLRHQLGDIPGAVADWELAFCNDFSLEVAKQKLESVQRAAYDAELTQVLVGPLSAKGLSVRVQHSGAQLDVHVHREVGTGINYYTLPDLIREHLVPLNLAEVSKFQLIGRVGDVNRPDWSQSYDLYKGQPCPPSNWQAAFSTLFLFPPFAIPALVQASQVKKLYDKGRYIESVRASKAVKGLCIAGSVTLGFFTLLPLGYAAYDSMKENPTFQVAEKTIQQPNRPYHDLWQN